MPRGQEQDFFTGAGLVSSWAVGFPGVLKRTGFLPGEKGARGTVETEREKRMS